MVGTAPCKLASATSRMRKWQSARTSPPRLKKSSAMRVFAHILERTSRVARQAADRLLSLRQTTVEHPEQVGCDPQAETLQANAVQLLDQLVAALKTEHQTQVPMQGPSRSGHAGMSQSGGGIAPIAELVVLRSLQEAVNKEIADVREHCADTE